MCSLGIRSNLPHCKVIKHTRETDIVILHYQTEITTRLVILDHCYVIMGCGVCAQ